VTRACLEELAKREGLSISIITKSNQIVRDIDVLTKIAARSSLQIDITVTTIRPRLAIAEPRRAAAGPAIAAVKECTKRDWLSVCRHRRCAGLRMEKASSKQSRPQRKKRARSGFSRECCF